ncbi:MAG: ATP synthase F1 subunit delta [Blastocatellia bacterium]
MSVIAIARRYADALADVAIARNQVEQTDGEVRTFAEMVRESRELHDLFASPIVSHTDKARVLDVLIARTRPSQTTANLLRTMLNHQRLHHIDAVYGQFRREINERKGTVLAEVTTAQPVGPDERQRLSRELMSMTGKQVQFEFKTDPALIGGVVTRIGSVIYDGSVRTQLQEIKHRLKEGDR